MMGISMSAAPVDLAHAKATAKQYLTKAHAGKLMAPAASEPVLLKQVMGDINKTTPVLYIFNTSTTFVIVSGDERGLIATRLSLTGLSPTPMPQCRNHLWKAHQRQ